MKEKLYNVIELILGVCLVAFGALVIVGNEFVMNWAKYAMIGFIAIKIALIICRGITFKLNKIFTIIEIALNLTVVVLLFIFQNLDALSFVISASCLVDLVTNIAKAFIYKKIDNAVLKTSFFGMENIIYIVFFIMLVINGSEATLGPTSVLIGVVILYKGVALIVGNYLIRSLINRTDFGQAVNKVRVLDIFFGLVTIVVMAAYLLPYLEPDNIKTPGDALWYCFTVITTIGFGDIVAKTVMGRLLSVVIGCYGIILVAILTSAFVVFLTKSGTSKDKRK